MTLDPQCQALIDMVNQAGGAPFDANDYQAAREGYRQTIAVYKHPTPTLFEVSDQQIPGTDGNTITIRHYRPNEDSDLPALIFFHGGGWAVGDLDTHDHVCRYLSAKGQCVVISVDYRLAPEHPFPAPFNDCLAVVRWAHRNAGELQIDASRIGVGGDSAGGNLAAAVCLQLREEQDTKLKFQLLIYPACDFSANHPSMVDNGEGYLLTRAAMEKFTAWYLPEEKLKQDFRASPQLADSHSDLPPAFVMTAGFDPLRDEGQHYAKTLTAAGVPTQYSCYDGMIHGFLRMGGKLDAAITALDEAAEWLQNSSRE